MLDSDNLLDGKKGNLLLGRYVAKMCLILSIVPVRITLPAVSGSPAYTPPFWLCDAHPF